MCSNGAIFARECTPSPDGAVIAFDREECPPGWRPHDASAGLFLVGVGSNPAHPDLDFPFGVRGGSPGQDSELRRFADTPSGPGLFVHTEETDNLPPYIALRFCTPGD